jgi:hypothetical protein
MKEIRPPRLKIHAPQENIRQPIFYAEARIRCKGILRVFLKRGQKRAGGWNGDDE